MARILVASMRGDATARDIAADFADFGLDVVTLTSVRDVAFDMRVPSGAGEASLRATVDGTVVSGILNRGLWSSQSPDQSSEERFADHECDAAWWAIAAGFPGPVVNRANGSSAIGLTEPADFAAAVGFRTPRMVIRSSVADPGPLLREGDCWNAHRLFDRRFVGRVTSAGSPPFGMLRFTQFDPEKTRTILVAGYQLFELSQSPGPAVFEPGYAANALGRYVSANGPCFVECTVQVDGPETTLLSLHALPSLSRYAHIRAEVHRSLAEALA